MKIDKIRSDFLILRRTINGKRLVYLDSAATSQKPRQVIEAMDKFYLEQNANVHRGIHTLSVEATDAYEAARQKVADFVGVEAAEIIFVRNGTEAINLVAYSWGRLNINKGDEIVLTIAEHHSNFVPWQQLAMENGATIKVVPVNENGEIDPVAFKKALTNKTKLVTFFHVSNVLGTINDVNRLSSIVHREAPKALIMVDGAQAVPHMKVNITHLECDFYVFTGHKMLGPTGIGVLWARREILEQMAPFIFGGEMISSVTLEKSEWNELPWKFEGGTPDIAGAIGLGAAVDYLNRFPRPKGRGSLFLAQNSLHPQDEPEDSFARNKVGMENVREHGQELMRYAMEKLSKIEGLMILGPKDPKKRAE